MNPKTPMYRRAEKAPKGIGADRVELLEAVYQELRSLARSYMRRERPDHTLQPTALVHEAYLRLAEQDRIVWQGREHFIAVAATMMRRILVNYAVRRNREKRGGGEIKVALDELNGILRSDDIRMIVLDEALVRMAKIYPKESHIVELRFFGGLSIAETAKVLSVSDTTVERSWRFARGWLLRELDD
jgi:RNA polymerase sigma factor (TIGR02999 family)